MQRLLLFLGILTCFPYGLLIELNPLSIGFDHVDKAQVIYQGEGSIGFDTFDNIYYPKYKNSSDLLSFSASFLYNSKAEFILITNNHPYPVSSKMFTQQHNLVDIRKRGDHIINRQKLRNGEYHYGRYNRKN